MKKIIIAVAIAVAAASFLPSAPTDQSKQIEFVDQSSPNYNKEYSEIKVKQIGGQEVLVGIKEE